MTPATLDELAALEAAATPGPWRSGRSDMLSYSGDGVGPFKNVYCDDERAEMHRGERQPYTVGRGEGEECVENAQLIAALRNAAPELIRLARIGIAAQVWASTSDEDSNRRLLEVLNDNMPPDEAGR